jgi:ubiquinone/menaquinone biosynthesis C-methylase UbiE
MSTQKDQAHWDTAHQKTHQPGSLHSHWAEEKEKLFPRNSLVVDVGGGTGEDAVYFLSKGHSVVLLDISPFALKKAEEKVAAANMQAKFAAKQSDYGLHQIPVKDNSVSVVYSRIALNYFDKDHTQRLFQDIYRILKPGGSAYLSFKSPEDKEELEYLEKTTVLFEPNVFIENNMLRSRFTVEQLNNMLTSVGIKNFKVTPFKEEIGTRRQGHQQTLYLNEITFSKV